MDSSETKILYNLFKTSGDFLRGYKNPHVPVLRPGHVQAIAQAQTQAGLNAEAVAQIRIPGVFDVNEILNCRACPLANTRNSVVVGEGPHELSAGNERVLVFVIGEGPGAEEDAQGRPFVGAAGQLLDKMLAAIQLSRKTNCYIGNVIKCRPPHNRDPLFEEIEACIHFLDKQLAHYKPLLILTLGRIATQYLLNTNKNLGALRGNFFSYKNIPLMPTYHPSALLRNEALKRPAWEDLKTFRQKLIELQAENYGTMA